MNKKESEARLGTMMRNYRYFTHKWRDRGYPSCPNCHNAIRICPVCKRDTLLPKAQTYPDMLIADSYDFIECKQSEEFWSLWDFSPNQEKVLTDLPERSWVFLLMGPGRSPDQHAFLIPWVHFLQIRTRVLEDSGKTVRFAATSRSKSPVASELFMRYQLVWIPKQGWEIPVQHIWWTCHEHKPIEQE